ncbi:MAG: [protein-PII] uridylyltransferase, partial [Alphaproteobacteria bacterium]|nr:[protein-PII] uridylyltransferase [Alphaproteobacteria bacterium]
MATIAKRRRIIDRGALNGRLDDMLDRADGGPGGVRADVLELLKSALAAGRDEIRQRFEAGGSGAETVLAQAFLIDQLIRVIYDFAAERAYPAANPTLTDRLSVVAVGGYGRQELAPFSDVDLLFLLPYKETPRQEQVIEYVLYMLWDLGLKVGHATRSIDECMRLSKRDLTIRTSILEARYLWGEQNLFGEMKRRFDTEIVADTGPEFVDAKLAERDQRHHRMGDSRYVLEPNVKEGKGGLRDLQTLFWIAKYLYRVDDVKDLVNLGVFTARDARRFAKAENFLWTVRCHLHYLAGRAEERFTFNVQTAIGERMGYTDHAGTRGVERVMKHYFLIAKDVGDLTRVLCAVLEERHKKRRQRFRFPSLSFRRRGVAGFRVDGNRLTVEADDAFVKDPVKLLRLFHEAQHHGLDIHPDALRLVTQSLKLIDGGLRADPEANRLFMEILTSDQDPETALKRLNEAGVFGRFIPDFGRVVAQMQYDMYHVYTVDEHTIRAIGILHRIENGELKDDHPVAASVIAEVQSRRVLYLALLLHDIAKGRGGDHSEIGGRIAEKLGPRLGLNDWETETVSWLVRHHLLMSATAFKRDIDNLKTVSDFVAAVQSPERLRLLLILTVADIRAVGPGVWNGWKATLLRELYWRAQEEMAGDVPAERRAARVENAKAALRDRLAGWDPAEIEDHIGRGYADYWLSFDTDTHVRHADLVRKAERGGLELHIETHVDASRAVTEIIIYTPDHPGLFARIAGAMALGAASIVDAKILTLANGMALDTFTFQDSRGGPFDNPERLKRLWKRIEDSLSGRLHPARELEIVRRRSLPSRTGVFKVPPRVLVDNKASAHHTVIEVNGRDRPGFLHDVTAALTGLGLQIASAHISTYGERVVDVFYVKDIFGLKIKHEDKLASLHESLLEA